MLKKKAKHWFSQQAGTSLNRLGSVQAAGRDVVSMPAKDQYRGQAKL